MRWNVWCIERGIAAAWLLIGDLVISRRVLVEMEHHGVPRFRLGLGLSLPVFPLDFVTVSLSPPIPPELHCFVPFGRFDSSFG